MCSRSTQRSENQIMLWRRWQSSGGATRYHGTMDSEMGIRSKAQYLKPPSWFHYKKLALNITLGLPSFAQM